EVDFGDVRGCRELLYFGRRQADADGPADDAYRRGRRTVVPRDLLQLQRCPHTFRVWQTVRHDCCFELDHRGPGCEGTGNLIAVTAPFLHWLFSQTQSERTEPSSWLATSRASSSVRPRCSVLRQNAKGAHAESYLCNANRPKERSFMTC